MGDRKTEQVNLRMSLKAKALLREAAAIEHRSVSNMVEHLLFTYCEPRGIREHVVPISELKPTVAGEKL